MANTLETLYLGNVNRWKVTVLDENGAADTGATVTGVTQTEDGTNVETGLSLTHDGSGVYSVVLDEGQYTAGQKYYAIATVVGTNTEDGKIRLRFLAANRDA